MNNNNNKNKQLAIVRAKKRNLTKNKKKSNNGNVGILQKLKEEPVSYSFKNTTGRPNFTGSSQGNIVVSHHEYIFDITSSSLGYHVAKIPMNPGLHVTFPWLSRIAPNWEAYRFKKIAFVFKPSAATSTSGTIMMVSDPNPLNSAPESKTDFLSLKGSTCCSVFKPLMFNPLTKDVNLEKSYYIRLKAPGSNEDLRLYDPCNFYVAYWGVPADTTIGEIHLMYSIEFINPKLNLGKQLTEQTETWALNGTSGVSASFPLGTNFLSRVIGKFATAGLKYLKGSSLGHLFTSTKSISKIFSSVIQVASNVLTGNIPGLAFKVLDLISNAQTNENNEFDSKYEVDFEDSDVDVLALYDSTPLLFTDISSTNVQEDTTLKTISQDGLRVSQISRVQLAPGQVLQLTWDANGTTGKDPTQVYTVYCTDKLKGADPY